MMNDRQGSPTFRDDSCMMGHRSRPMAHVETRSAPADTTIAVDAPADLPADQWAVWAMLAPLAQAAGALHTANLPMFRVLVTLASTYVFLRVRGSRIDPAFERELLRQAAQFSLTPGDIDRCVASLPCAPGVH